MNSMDEHEEGCSCAVCDTLIMSPDPDWTPVAAPDGVVRRCVFCRESKQVHHFTRLSMPICGDCNATL